MAKQRRTRPDRRGTVPSAPRTSTNGRPDVTSTSPKPWPLIGLVLLVALVVVVGGVALVSGPLAATAVGPADDGQGAALVQGEGGSWAEIAVDDLDAMMPTKDFTLLNVKTPYIGEIDGTDLYIPYDQLTARADELPADKDAPIVVYCRTGNQSGIAAQILVDLGYTDITNVDGGMAAWTDSGRALVEVDRS